MSAAPTRQLTVQLVVHASRLESAMGFAPMRFRFADEPVSWLRHTDKCGGEWRSRTPGFLHHPCFRGRLRTISRHSPYEWRRGRGSNSRDRETSLGLANPHIAALSPLLAPRLLDEQELDDELLESSMTDLPNENGVTSRLCSDHSSVTN